MLVWQRRASWDSHCPPVGKSQRELLDKYQADKTMGLDTMLINCILLVPAARLCARHSISLLSLVLFSVKSVRMAAN